LELALAEKEEIEKQAGEDVARLQKEVKVFKLMRYRDEYNDGVQGKPLRYPLDAGSLHADQGTIEVLASHALLMPDASVTTAVVGTSWISCQCFLLRSSLLKPVGTPRRTLPPELLRHLTQIL